MTHQGQVFHMCARASAFSERLVIPYLSLSSPLSPLCPSHYYFFLFFIFINKVFIFFINLFIYFWLHWVFVAAHGLSLVVASGSYPSLWCAGFSLRWLLLLRSTGSRCAGSAVVACGL